MPEATGPLPGPPAYDPESKSWIVSRFEDAAWCLRSPHLVIEDLSAHRRTVARGLDISALDRALASFALLSNPPRHGPLRRWNLSALHSIADGLSADRAGELTRAVIATLPRDEPFDGLVPLCDAVAIRLLADAVGLDAAGVARVAHAGANLFYAGQRVHDRQGLASLDALARRAETELETLLRESGRARRLLTEGAAAWPQAAEDGPAPAMAAVFLLAAGSDTTAALMANGLALCLTDRAAHRAFAGPGPASRDATRELVRLAGGLRQLTTRKATGRIRVGGREIPRGARIVVDVGRANRDPSVFPEADRFRPGPERAAHLAYGAGAHACVGAAVAGEAVAAFLRVVLGSGVRLDQPHVHWPGQSWMRRPERLVLRLDAPPAPARFPNRR